ncbi:hypothetical protein Tco_1433316 [Tanacetum coccineum]
MLPSITEKFNKEKERNEKLKEVKARLNFEGCFETSWYSESRTMSTRKHEKRHRSRCSSSPRPCLSVFSKIRRERSRSPRQRSKEEGVFKWLGSRGKSVSAHSDSYNQHSRSRYSEALSKSEDIEGGHWKSKSKKKKSKGDEDDLSQPWVCKEIDLFTPRIRYFDFPKIRIPSHIKTYDGSEDPEDHLKIFQAAAKTERWAMPTWCHMCKTTGEDRRRRTFHRGLDELRGVITLKSSKLVPLEYAMVSRPEGNLPATKPIVEERIKCNLDIFARKPADMTGVPRRIVEHRLNVREGCSPVRQKKRGQAADKNQAIQEEVGKFVEAGIMKEVHYHDWLSNPVMVKKHEDSWRMCVKLKDLNKACPKDGYPLLEID